MKGTDWNNVKNDAGLFLHRVDFEERKLVFLPTRSERIRESSFLDGRTNFSHGEPLYVRWDEIPDEQLTNYVPPRFIFHVAFCGSTILSRAFDVSEQCISLREPQALVDLADWKVWIKNHAVSSRDYERIFFPAAALLLRPIMPQICIKPSNWANTIIVDLMKLSNARCVFIDMEDKAYLFAVLRGGRDRLAYVARATAHFAGSFSDGNRLMGKAIESCVDPIEKVLRLALLGLFLQRQLFSTAREFSKSAVMKVRHEAVFGDLSNTAISVSKFMQLGIPSDDIQSSIDRNKGFHSKDPHKRFDQRQRQEEDSYLESNYTKMVQRSLDWSYKAFQ